MNPFERHGIGHLSPSSLALYRNSPALWCLKYLWHVQDDEMPFAWRGRAVEAAVDAIVMDNASDDSAIELAMAVFESEAGGELTPEVNRERNAIPDMVRRASPLFRRLGQPIASLASVGLRYGWTRSRSRSLASRITCIAHSQST